MNQLCRVCGEPAAGFHFGAFTCEGCKSFFGRTYNNLNSVSECKNNSECVINKKNRTSCKACRLRKCLFVGMSKSGSRYGRRSNWFKIHCLLQEQQLQQQQQHQHQHHQQKQQQHHHHHHHNHHHLHQQHQMHRNQQNAAASAANFAAMKPWECAKSDAALLDIDNNNTALDHTKSESPPFTSPHRLLTAPDSPTSFWSTRPTALTVPHQHALPYFISPFLQNSLQPATHNYLLPFLPIRPPLCLQPLVISPTPSSLHSSPTLLVAPNKKTTTPDPTLVDDSSLEKLRCLGPIQDQPIDLSSAKVMVERNSPSLVNQCMESIGQRVPDAECEDRMVAKGEHRTTHTRKSTTPLDLRRSRL